MLQIRTKRGKEKIEKKNLITDSGVEAKRGCVYQEVGLGETGTEKMQLRLHCDFSFLVQTLLCVSLLLHINPTCVPIFFFFF